MKLNKRFIVVAMLVIGIISLVVILLNSHTNEYQIDNGILVQEAKLSNDTLEKNYNMSYKENLKKMESLPILRTTNSIIDANLMASDEEKLVTLDITKSYFTEAGKNKVKINIKATYVDGVEIKRLKWDSGDRDYDYMDQNGTTLIFNTSGNTISSFFDISETGTYTIFLEYQKDSTTYRHRTTLTINNLVDPESEFPKITISRDSENGRKITINATNSTSKITELKIIKLNSKDEEVDFSKQGTSIPIQSSNNVNATYTASEDGFYRIYAKSESGAYSTLTTVLVQDSAITTNIEKDSENGRKITITSTSTMDDIDTMKIAKASDVTGSDYFETKGTVINITPGRTVTATYIAPENGIYIIYVKDKSGCSLRSQVILYEDDFPISISVEQDDSNDKLLHISANCSIEIIKEMKIASGRQQSDYFETGGTNLNITQGNNVKADYTVDSSGNYTIYAATDNMKFTYTIGINISETVNVESVSLNKNATTITIGNTEQLTATVNPSNATNKNVTWESDKPSIADVDNTGKITAKGIGEAVITVRTVDGNKTAQCKVTVEGIAVTGVILSETEKTMTIGDTDKLIAEVNPSNATNKNVTWESDKPEIVKVDNEGNIEAVGIGEAVITVRTVDGNKTAQCRVTVEGIAVTGVILSETEKTMTIGDTDKLIAEVNPSNATNKAVTWESDEPSIADIDNTGKITAKGIGTTTIRVRTVDGNKTAECRVTVEGIAVTGVSLNKNETTMTIGNTEQLTATINPNNATNKAVTWESDEPSIADVDSTGNVTAVGIGTTTIRVRTVDGNKTAECRVTVEGIAVTGVSLSETEKTMTIGDTDRLIATINPSNATNKAVTWESDKPEIVKVDNEGSIEAVGIGEATITVRTIDGNKTAECRVTVEGIAVTGVSLNKNETTITIGGTEKLTATINPNNATNKAVTWKSDEPSIADVDEYGNVTAVGIGTTTIRVKTVDGNKTAECRVTVEGIAVTGVSLNKNETTMTIGNTEQLTATINPNNATNKAVTWESDEPSIADIDSTGKITAKGIGEAVITVRTVDGNKTAQCKVTVEGIKVESVSLNKNATTITIGNTEQLTATINPSNATNKNVRWESTNPNVAAVDSTGRITAVGVGETIIRVKTIDGEYTAECKVTVEGVAVTVTGVSLNKSETTMTIGNTEQLIATINPSNATNKNVRWESTNPNVATVDSTGKVTAVGVGEATIRVTTIDGEYISECRITVNGGEDPEEPYEITVDKQLGANNTEVSIKITITGDTSKINIIKIGKGSLNVDYFKNNGGQILNIDNNIAEIKVTENSIYTIYIEDTDGNTTLKEINVTGIQQENPDDNSNNNNQNNNQGNVNNSNQNTNNNNNSNNGYYVDKLPYTGKENNIPYYILGGVCIVILAGGIILIRKYVIK